MPHPVAVDDIATRCFRNRDHTPVHMCRNACDHLFGGRAQTVCWPRFSHHFEVATDATRSHNNRRGSQGKIPCNVAVGFLPTQGIIVGQNGARNSFGRPIFHLDPVHLMAEFEGDQAGLFMFQTAAYEMFDDAFAGAPS